MRNKENPRIDIGLGFFDVAVIHLARTLNDGRFSALTLGFFDVAAPKRKPKPTPRSFSALTLGFFDVA